MESTTSARQPEFTGDTNLELILVWRARKLRFSVGDDAPFAIGLRRDCDLVVCGAYSSRLHATLRWQRNRFELQDHSTNGTYVQLEDEQLSLVHRTSVGLWGTGYLSFGEPLTAENSLRFSHA